MVAQFQRVRARSVSHEDQTEARSLSGDRFSSLVIDCCDETASRQPLGLPDVLDTIATLHRLASRLGPGPAGRRDLARALEDGDKVAF